MTTQEPAIVIENLAKSYGHVQAVRGISMSIERGEIFGFLGPNGAGKTTTIRCMLDVIRPSSGAIRVLGLDAQNDTHALHQHIGYLPGDVRLPGRMTGKQVINYFANLQGREPVLLNHLIERFDVKRKRPLKGYSKGMRQKIGVVLAFMCYRQMRRSWTSRPPASIRFCKGSLTSSCWKSRLAAKLSS